MTEPRGDERSREEQDRVAARSVVPEQSSTVRREPHPSPEAMSRGTAGPRGDERLREEQDRVAARSVALEQSSTVRREPHPSPEAMSRSREQDWPLFEVFLRGKRGLNHVHVGSLHAADAEMALRHARDLYTRRNEGVSIWVVASADITASSPTEKDPFFAPSADKIYRHPTFYEIPENVPHI
jgi:ring-1,2-phenylacetyl-CoA epoxidase subunit PaaB